MFQRPHQYARAAALSLIMITQLPPGPPLSPLT